MGGHLFVVISVVMIVFALVLGSLVLGKAAKERSMVNKRFLEIPGGGKSFWASQISGKFTDPDVIRAKLEKDSELSSMLWQAGMRQASQRSLYYIASLATPVVFVVLAMAYHWISRNGFQNPWLVFLMVGIGGFLLPKRVIGYIAQRRKQRITEELPMFVQILKILFDAGLAVEQSLRVMCAESREALPEITQEMDFVLKRTSSGLDIVEELDHMAKLMGVEDFSEIIGILKQMIRQGGSARTSLTKLGELIDDRRMTTIQEKVSKLSAKMAMVMIIFMFPALLILIAAPGFMAITKALSRL